ncbi:MAG: hypothetical protein ACPGN3_08455 [Opitutales bacterium]
MDRINATNCRVSDFSSLAEDLECRHYVTLQSMSLTFRHIATLLGLFVFAAHSPLGQIESSAPIRDFRLPKFGENGRLEWDLSGDTGTYVSKEQVDVTGVLLRVFSDDDAPKEIFQMRSKRASVFLEEERALGSGSVYGVSDEFVISGEQWQWDAQSDRLVIEEDVRVMFNLSLSNLLK